MADYPYYYDYVRYGHEPVCQGPAWLGGKRRNFVAEMGCFADAAYKKRVHDNLKRSIVNP
jgi:hypothetical protein